MMYILKLMKEKNMTRAALSRISGVPESTLRDILNGVSRIERCESLTLALIADALDTTVDDILVHVIEEEYDCGNSGYDKCGCGDCSECDADFEAEWEKAHENMNTMDEEKQHPAAPIAVPDVSANAFYHFLDNAKTHLLGRGMDFEIARATCENGWVDRFFDIGSASIALFLVGLADYLCRRKRVKPFPEYEKYRSMRLASPIYPIRNMCRPGMTAQEYDRNRSRVQAFAIPELARMNIFLSEDDIWQKERAYGR